jgi:hypothetical protein
MTPGILRQTGNPGARQAQAGHPLRNVHLPATLLNVQRGGERRIIASPKVTTSAITPTTFGPRSTNGQLL